MKHFLFIVIILFPHFLISQDVIPETTLDKPTKNFIGFSFSPDYRCRKLVLNADTTTFQFLIDVRNHSEIPKPGFTTGVKIQIALTETVALETGLLFSQKGYGHPKTRGNWPSQDSLFQPSTSTIKSTNSSYFLDIPVLLHYTFGKKKIRFICSAGIAVNIFTHEIFTFIIEDENGRDRSSRKKDSPYNRLNISAEVGCGIEYKLNENTKMTLMPGFKYGLTKFSKTYITGYWWNAGIDVGIFKTL